MQRGSVIRLGRSFLLLAVALNAAPAAASFVTFESGQVRPLALSPDGSQLFAANTPDDRLEIFSVGSDGLTHTGSVPVGLEPLAVVNLFGDTPRALAVSPGGSTVYAAVFHSGNRTTTLTEGVVCDDASGAANNTVAGPCSVSSVSYPGGLPNPDTAGGTKGPE